MWVQTSTRRADRNGHRLPVQEWEPSPRLASVVRRVGVTMLDLEEFHGCN